jgi:hypothetical protein
VYSLQVKCIFTILVYIKIKNKLIATCAFASTAAQDALNALLKSLAIIKVKSEKQVLLMLLMLLID